MGLNSFLFYNTYHGDELNTYFYISLTYVEKYGYNNLVEDNTFKDVSYYT